MNIDEIVELIHGKVKEFGYSQILPKLSIKKQKFYSFVGHIEGHPKTVLNHFSTFGYLDIGNLPKLRIRFPKQFDYLYSKEIQRQVILHETAHIFDFAENGIKIAENPHGDNFKRQMKKLDCDLYGVNSLYVRDMTTNFKLKTIRVKSQDFDCKFSIGIIQDADDQTPEQVVENILGFYPMYSVFK